MWRTRGHAVVIMKVAACLTLIVAVGVRCVDAQMVSIVFVFVCLFVYLLLFFVSQVVGWTVLASL